jgi:hypothetical protein
MHVPLWAVALVFAAAAPFGVRMFADALAQRVKKRTERAIHPPRGGRGEGDSLS